MPYVPVSKGGLLFGLTFLATAVLALTVTGIATNGWFINKTQVGGIKTITNEGFWETCTHEQTNERKITCQRHNDDANLCANLRLRLRTAGTFAIFFVVFAGIQFFALLSGVFGGKSTPNWWNFITFFITLAFGLVAWAIMVGTFRRKNQCVAGPSMKDIGFKLGYSFAVWIVGWVLSMIVGLGHIVLVKNGDGAEAAKPAAAATQPNEPSA